MKRLLLIAAITACQAVAGTVPDESVLPQWTKMFGDLLVLRNSNFQRSSYRRNSKGAVTDDELLRGADAAGAAPI